jgi:hypothetical protein
VPRILSHFRPRGPLIDMGRLLLALALLPACDDDPTLPDLAAPADLALPSTNPDLAHQTCVRKNACGDCDDASCHTLHLGAPFPLPNDQPPDPHVDSHGLDRDADGNLSFAGGRCPCGGCPDALIANATDWGRGTLSRIDTYDQRELARYFTVTCVPCPKGCCSNDDPDRFAARLQNQADPGHQPVQLADNFPSRTSVDWNGDVWVENRAPGGQASITKISGDPARCADRNKNGTIETSKDTNGDGLIQTDCNGDGQPDDLASVKGVPCANGMPQEFFGLDDECVLLTVNLGPPGGEGRALALGPGANDFAPSDPWAGSSTDAILYRVDGATGIIKDRATLPIDCHPDGVAVDSSAIAWTAPDGQGPLCWFATKNPSDAGTIRDPQSGPLTARVIALDRDQNLWLADRLLPVALRYAPDRSAGTKNLGQGFWTRAFNAGQGAGASGSGAGIALDSRSANGYFAWLVLASGWLVRIPASTLPLAKMDQDVDGAGWSALPLQGFSPIAVGVAQDSNLQVVSSAPAATIRILADATGKITPPDLVSAPKPPARCPAGSRCLLKDNPASDPGSDSYSDFTTFGLRSLCSPRGYYRYFVDGGCGSLHTEWRTVDWVASIPINTSITLRARSGPTPQPDPLWGGWTPDFPLAPADLLNGGPLAPNRTPESSHLEIELDFATSDKNVRPTLKSFDLVYRCVEPLP